MTFFFDFIWATLSTLLFPNFISDSSLDFSNSYFSVIMWIALIVLFRYTRRNAFDRRMFIYTHILGFFFSFFTACGYSLDKMGSMDFSRLLVSIILYTHVYAEILVAVWHFLMENELRLDEEPKHKPLQMMAGAVDWLMRHPVGVALILLVCWTPCFIANFPGGFVYDMTNEFNQFTDGFNGNLPLLHSVIITRLLPFAYQLTGSHNTGVAIYTIIQMILISVMYTHILCRFYKQGANKLLLMIILLYCGAFPVIQILVTQTVRDVMFSALLTYTVFLFYLMISDRKAFFQKMYNPVFLGLLLSVTLLSRNNNAGIVMISIVILVSVLVWILNRKISFRGSSAFALTCIGSYIFLGMILTALCQPLQPSDAKSSLSVLSQPLCRAYFMEPETWTEEELEEFYTYVRMDELQYVPENADPTKSRLRHMDEDFGNFFLFWCKIGKEHKLCYVDALLANTQDMWFPASVIDGYQKAGAEVDYEKCYYSISGQNEEPVGHENLWPKVLNFYTKIGLYISFEKIPIISMLFSIGFQFWIVLNCLFYSLYRKNKQLYLPLAIIMIYTIISAFVPLVLLRYFAAIFFSMPMIIVFTVQPGITFPNKETD